MSSWHYAFMFPSLGDSLTPSKAIDVALEFGLTFDSKLLLAIEIDDDGHLEFEEESLLRNGANELKERLRNEEQFLIEANNQELFFSFCFAMKYQNPYLMIGWSRRLFSELPESRATEYWHMLRCFAKSSLASYVVVVDDPPDYFEDRFLEFSGQRCLDSRMESGREYEIQYVWVDAASQIPLPIGIERLVNVGVIDGFIEFSAEAYPLCQRL